MSEQEIRAQVAREIRDTLGPLLELGRFDGGYDCCGCSTYDWIVEDAARVAEGRPVMTAAERTP